MKKILCLGLLFFLALGLEENIAQNPQGKLFIIGGGKRPPVLLERLLAESIRSETGYIVILPMASEEPDSAIFYAQKQFTDVGFGRVGGMFIYEQITENQVDSLLKADLIYITGGDQNKFMQAIQNTQTAQIIRQAYQNGSTIAGTSAGAAVMSKKMITGNALKATEYEETFYSIEAGNLEIAEGLGLLEKAIIDQHFIRRSRYNRLLTAVLEYPDYQCIGIEESTAILVTSTSEGLQAEVVGEAQVIVFQNPNPTVTQDRNYLKGKSILVDILTAGDIILLKE